ncbi:vegetative cell wall protein gp1-like [Orbicella faveolata]|uniref:vegetative cell wall protein gp1-like n=1 Tax=Orbicella faveolata TaxID=48498 RepID=UPI0009E2B599|nr:vegetative cell wall protein gp1-like [Orbicella faveolata]
METKPIIIFRVALLLLLCLLLQEKCIKKCLEEHKPSKRPTRPGELADEENDPRRPRPSGLSPRPHRPSGASPRTPRPSGKNCIKACHEKYKPSILPTKPGKEADEESDPRRPRPSGVSPRPPRPSGVSPRPPRPSGVSPHPSVKPLFVSLV